jgi:nucleoside phosphorylase
MPARRATTDNRNVDVAIVCTLAMESDPFVKRLRNQRKTVGNRFHIVEGDAAGKRLAVLRTEPSPKRLAEAVDALLFVHRPRWVVAAGFAIGIDPTLLKGRLVIADELADESGRVLKINLRAAPEERTAGEFAFGRLVSLRSPPRSKLRKSALRERTGAIATDRVTFTIAEMCRREKTRLLAVRVLIDDATGDIAPGTRAVLHPSASFRAGGWVGAFLGGSGKTARLMKMRHEARRHAERLADLLMTLVATLE